MNKGQFQEGHKKLGGRTKGTKNKATLLGKKAIEDYFNNNGFELLFSQIEELEPTAKVMAKIKLLSFIMPKLKAVDISEYQKAEPKKYRTPEEIQKDIDRLNS